MSLAKNKSGIEIPDRMRNKLEKFQKKVWIIKLAEGILAAAFGLLVSYLLVFVLDRFFETPALVRTAILIVGALGLGVWFPLVCHKWVWKSRRLEQVAKLLKFKFPRLGDHLLGIIELVNNSEESGRSEALTRAALAQVDEETKNRDFSNAVPAPKHIRWGLIAGIPAVIAATVLVLVPAAGGNALVRWLMPWKHTERYTFAQIEALPNSIVVPVAEDSSLSATLTEQTKWKPSTGSAFVGGTTVSAEQENGQYGFTLPPLKKDGRLKVSIGDIRKSVEVTPMPRPELQSLMANIKLPEYLQRDELVTKDIRGGVVSTVAGSEVSFVATASREIAEATADGSSIQVKGEQMLTSAVNVDESSVMEFQWVDTLGLTARKPMQLKIRAKADQQPALSCPELEKKNVIQVKDVLTFDVKASDDFGVQSIGMEWLGTVGKGNDYEPAKGSKIVSAGSPESTEMTSVATFSPERLDIKPQLIQFRLYATDYLPNREPVYSATYSIYVLSEDDHAIWISERIDEWNKVTQEIYEQEVLNHENNEQLRGLSPEDLDKRENRKKIMAQVAAEQANARRLEEHTKSGTELAREASQNDQFSAKTIDDLSKNVQKLEDIADNRMPSVADLLEKAAEAPTGSGQPGEPGQPQEGQPGQPQEGQPGQPQEGQPGQPGQPQEGQPGQPQEGQPGQPQEGQPGQPQPGQPQPGQPQEGEPQEGESQGSPSDSPPSVKDDQSEGGNSKKGGDSEGEEGQEPPPGAPSITIKESSIDKPPEEEGETEEGETPPSSGGPPAPLTLPGVQLQDNSAPEEEEPSEPSEPQEPSDAGELLNEAVEAQEQLLIEFQKVAEEMQQIVQNLEGSTFVKRLKAMSRRHLELAQDVNDMTLDEFGSMESEVEKNTRMRANILADRELFHRQTTSNIQEDMSAFINRIDSETFRNVLEEMKSSEVLEQLNVVSEKIVTNESGGSIAHAEMLADTFDRWAEQLVDAAEQAEGGEPQEQEGEAESSEGLPPALILEFMKILEKEIDLREETRGVQQAKPQLEEEKFKESANSLGVTQDELHERLETLVKDIKELENAEDFENEVGMLEAAGVAMGDAVLELFKPNTGPEAIAAETEVIELMLQAQRSAGDGGGGGGGGSDASDGNRSGSAQGISALALRGLGEDEEAQIEERTVQQAVGKSGYEVPEEFRYGMDQYFEALEALENE